MQMIVKETGETESVYDIKYDGSGFPHFLIYKDGQWILKSAKHFRPPNNEDFKRIFGELDFPPLSPCEDGEPKIDYIG